jgi:hypothetical protein
VGVPVTLRVIWPGTSEWVDLQRTVTGGKGLATGDTGNRAGTFRFSYEGDEARDASWSAEEIVRPAKVPAGLVEGPGAAAVTRQRRCGTTSAATRSRWSRSPRSSIWRYTREAPASA